MICDEPSAQAWLKTLPDYDDAAQARLLRFAELLIDENRHQNLISLTSSGQLWQRHIADSAQLLRLVPRGTRGPWLDLGSGAGFPGVPIAILCPQISVTLVETRAKRSGWLDRLCSALGLANCRVVPTRLELLPTEPFAIISARAFAPLEPLLELSARFSTAETLWLLPKGRSAAHELRALTGWRHRFHVEQSITDPAGGLIVGHLDGKSEALI